MKSLFFPRQRRRSQSFFSDDIEALDSVKTSKNKGKDAVVTTWWGIFTTNIRANGLSRFWSIYIFGDNILHRWFWNLEHDADVLFLSEQRSLVLKALGLRPAKWCF